MTCTSIDCGNPAEMYLCNQCISDLAQWIDKAHQYAPELNVTIARLDVLRRTSNTGGGGNKAGSRAPINLHAVELQQNLYSIDRDARTYAADQAAAMWAWTIQDWVTQAEQLISGPEPERPVDQLEARRKLAIEVPQHLRMGPLLEWLQVTHGIELKPSRLRKWAERGVITRTNDDGHPTYDPAIVLIQARKDTAA